MSRQQINLYSPLFRKEKKKFSAEAMLQGAAAMILGIMVLYGFNHWRAMSLKDALAQAETGHAAAIKRLQEVTQKFGVGGQSKVAMLEEEIAARERLRARLAGVGTGDASGYSAFFLALARQHVSGVWLTGFDVADRGERMMLQGRTRAPERVPQYIQRLSREDVFAGREFHVFSMTQPEEAKAGYVEFTVRTEAVGGARK